MKQKFNLSLLLLITIMGFWIYLNHGNNFWNNFENSFCFGAATTIAALMAVKFQEKSENYVRSDFTTAVVLLNTFASCTLTCLILLSYLGAILRNTVGIYPHPVFYWIPSLIVGIILAATLAYSDYMVEGNTG